MELINVPVWWHFMYNETIYSTNEIAEKLQAELSDSVLHCIVDHRDRSFKRRQVLEMNDERKIKVYYMTDEKGLSFNAIVLNYESNEEEE
jgi:hypothetical protein